MLGTVVSLSVIALVLVKRKKGKISRIQGKILLLGILLLNLLPKTYGIEKERVL
jgi:hypothetical protein